MAKLQIGFIHLDFSENAEEESKDYVTCLSTERLFRYAGIPSEGIIGLVLRPLNPSLRGISRPTKSLSCLLEVLSAIPDPEDEPESLGLPN